MTDKRNLGRATTGSEEPDSPPSEPPSGRVRGKVYPRILANLKERPPLVDSLLQDATAYAAHQLTPIQSKSRLRLWLHVLRLAWVTDDYLGLALYRLRSSLHASGVPIVPRVIHRLCIALFGIRIGPRVVLKEGIYIPHGNVVIDGVVLIGKGCIICPWVVIGLLQGNLSGPEIGENVFVGTGATILGEIVIGEGAVIGAGAVVVGDVPPFATVAGVPARVVGRRPAAD